MVKDIVVTLPIMLVILGLGIVVSLTIFSIVIAHNKNILPCDSIYELKDFGRKVECAFVENKMACKARILAEKKEELAIMKIRKINCPFSVLEKLENEIKSEESKLNEYLKKEKIDLRHLFDIPCYPVFSEPYEKCKANGGTWHWEEDFVGCEDTMDKSFNCDDETMSTIRFYCYTVGAKPVCNSYNLYCKY